MSDKKTGPEPTARLAGGTEYTWCKAVPSGTGISALALLLSKPPDIKVLQHALNNLQNTFPILRSKLRYNATANTFTFLTPPPTSPLQIKPFDLQSTKRILQSAPTRSASVSISPFQRIVEHELNQNAWTDPSADADLMFASVYTLSETQWAVVLRIHSASCDRTAAVTVLRELGALIRGGEQRKCEKNDGVCKALEDLIPSEMTSKPFWSRGVDLLGYSLNSLRHANMDFVDAVSPRCSQMVRLQLNEKETQRLLAACKSRKIKLCGALVAAGLIAAHSTKNTYDDQREKYAVVTLTDSRSVLEPAPRSHHLGFYHSAILNTYDVADGEKFWELATKTYEAFANAKSSNKHFSDMADLNLLMCKAIENPGMTASSSMRTSCISVFEDSVMDDTTELHRDVGLNDYIGCSSVHGVGPSIALFDTIRNGLLDCECVYPLPLHSRDQMLGVVDKMKTILVKDKHYA